MFSRIAIHFLWLSFCATAHSDRVRDFYINLLQQEEQAIKTKFLAVAGLSTEDWHNALEQAKIDYQTIEDEVRAEYSLYPLVSQDITAITHKLLAEQGLDPKKIHIFEHAQGGTLSAYASIILISQNFLTLLDATKIEQEAVIMHEIMHIRQQDQIERQCIRSIIQKGHVLHKMILVSIRNRWQRFREKRADILVALTSSERAKALAHLYEKILNSNLYNPGDTNHPPLRARIEYMKELHNQMELGNPVEHNIFEKSLFNLKHSLYTMVDRLTPDMFVQKIQ